jgi:hypothetical protein
METLSPTGPVERLPSWLASKIRRAAIFTCLGWCVPFSAAAILFLVIALMLAYELFDSMFPPLFWLAVFLGAMLLVGRELAASLRVCLQPERSPEVAYLRRYGSLASVTSEVQEELRNPANRRFGEETTVTHGWVVVSGGSRFAARRLDDVAWAFPKTETLRLNFVIPVWRTHFVLFRSAVAPEAQAKCSSKETARLLDHLAACRPGILLGHTADAERLWEADPAAFLAAVQGNNTSDP